MPKERGQMIHDLVLFLNSDKANDLVELRKIVSHLPPLGAKRKFRIKMNVCDVRKKKNGSYVLTLIVGYNKTKESSHTFGEITLSTDSYFMIHNPEAWHPEVRDTMMYAMSEEGFALSALYIVLENRPNSPVTEILHYRKRMFEVKHLLTQIIVKEICDGAEPGFIVLAHNSRHKLYERLDEKYSDV